MRAALRQVLLGARVAGNTLAYALGDSRTAQNLFGGNWRNNGNGVTFGRQLIHQRLRLNVAQINGGSGETAATIRSTRFPTALASSARLLILLAGVNQGSSLEQDIADLSAMAQGWVASAPDRVVWLFDELCPDSTMTGGSSFVGAKMTRHVALRDAIRALSNPRGGIYIVPSWQQSTGGNDGIVADPLFYIPADGIHCGPYGAFKLGRMLAANTALLASIPTFNVYASRTFTTDQTMTGDNFTGPGTVAAAGLSLIGTGHSSVGVSALDNDGVQWAEFNLNGSADFQVNRSTGPLPAGVTAGVTTVQGILRYRVASGLTNVRGMQLEVFKQAGTSFGNADGANAGASSEWGSIPFTETTYGTLLTDPVLVPADATSVRWRFMIMPQRIATVSQTMVGSVSIAFGGLILS